MKAKEQSDPYEADKKKLEALLEKAYAAGLKDGFAKGMNAAQVTAAMNKQNA